MRIMMIHNFEKFFDDNSEMRRVLSKGKFTTMALSDGNDPYILPLSYGLDALENILYFHTSRTGTKIDFLKSNSYVCGTVILDHGYQGGYPHYQSIVYKGLIEVIHNKEEKLRAMESLFHQLEEDSANRIERIIEDPASLDNILIMKLIIDEMTEKENPG
jgi:nitroimidazol reductase NimA-like FMN-containing flavoprotein (pyridoxamine 5'-phosphate oxidase superfamily)